MLIESGLYQLLHDTSEIYIFETLMIGDSKILIVPFNQGNKNLRSAKLFAANSLVDDLIVPLL